jgi:hypothetical protein
MRTDDMSPLWRSTIGFDRRSAASHRDRCCRQCRPEIEHKQAA